MLPEVKCLKQNIIKTFMAAAVDLQARHQQLDAVVVLAAAMVCALVFEAGVS